MKRIIKFFTLVLTFLCVFTLGGCKYKEEAGKYELYSITMNGRDAMEYYEYYNIILESNGDCTIESKGIEANTTYSAELTFEIEGEKIFFYTELENGAVVTEEYQYVNSEIIMETNLTGVDIVAKFKRATEE